MKPPTYEETHFIFRVSSPAPRAGIDWLVVMLGRSMSEILQRVLVPGRVALTEGGQVVHQCELRVGSYFELPWTNGSSIQIGARGPNTMLLRVPSSIRGVIVDGLTRSSLTFEETSGADGLTVFNVPFPRGANVYFTVPLWGRFGILKE